MFKRKRGRGMRTVKVKQKFQTIAIGALSVCILFFANTVPAFDMDSTKSVKESIDSDENNYIAMLNYVSLINDEINESSNNRLLLEQVYSSLMNNTAPHAIDDRTQIQMTDMLQTIDEYRMIDVKRERLEYIYQQNQAQALRNAIPNPLGLLSSVRSFRLSSLIASVVYMAVDAKTSYDSAMADAQLQYLQDGWELDDAETATLNQSQEQLWNYMIDIVHESDMPDKYALSNDTIKEFVKYKNNSNLSRRITYLESNKSIFEKFGDYWLTLADSYYENEDYEKCISAIDAYNELGIEIFRKDHNLAKELPVAISAAQECISNEKRQVKKIDGYLSLLKENLETGDWSLRYFAAQTDIYLYSKTGDESYLKDAYSLTKNNVNYLIDEQSQMNKTYLAALELKETPENATKEQKNEVKEYNKMLKNNRKTELSPIYEPLYLNCDLLFSLAEEINISEEEKISIEKILHGSTRDDPLFLIQPLDDKYYFSNNGIVDDSSVTFKKDTITISAALVSDLSKITVTVGEGKDAVDISDWTVKKVNRNDGDPVSDITVEYTSKEAGKTAFADGTPVMIVITPVDGSNCTDITVKYKTIAKKWLKFIPITEFERVQ